MVIEVVIKILITILAIAIFSVMVGLIFTSILRKMFFPTPQIAHIGDVLSLSAIVNDNIILGKDGTSSQIIKIHGIGVSSKTNSELKSLINTKQRWLDMLAERGVRHKILTLRREYKHDLNAGAVSPLLKSIHEKWMENFKKIYTNTHYIILTIAPKTKEGIKEFIKNDLYETNTGLLKELSALTIDLLNEFKPEIIDNRGEWSELMSFLRELVTANKEEVRPKVRNIGDAITERITFLKNSKIIQYDNGLFAKIISLNKWSEVASSEMLKEIQSIPGRLEIIQLFNGYGKKEAVDKLRYQQKQKQIVAKNAHLNDEYLTAIEEVSAGKTSLYDYQLSVMVFSEDLKELDTLGSQVKRILLSYGLTPIVEARAKEAIWRTRFPGHDVMVRPTNPQSINLAYLINFENEPIGLDNCDWGTGPIRSFKTASDGVYSLQFHIHEGKEANGHTLVVAPTEGGKTTFFEHLIAGALRHSHLRAFIFDRLNGTRIFTKAVGGNYVDFTDGTVPLNPFVCEDTHANRDFLKNFLMMLAKNHDDQSNEEAFLVVDQIFKVPKEERILKKCFSQVARRGSPFANGLRKWALDPTLAGWFNGSIINKDGKEIAFDSLNLDASRLTAFEMTKIQGNPETAAAVTTYIMHRIRSIGKEGFPHLIFIDETAPMLEDPVFEKNVAVLLNEHRKLRGVVAVCFQNPNKITPVIQNACKTRFLFINPDANKEDYSAFDLTQFEWEYIKGVSRISKSLKRSVLVKRRDGRTNESVILNVDLAPLGNLLQIYRSGSEPLKIVNELEERWGMSQWVEKYLNWQVS